MAYLPLFVQMSQKKVLLVGGGKVAYAKLKKLLDFTQNITVIALECSIQIQNLIKHHGLTLYEKGYEVGDIEGYDMVIVATNTQALHHSIYRESRQKHILMNSTDITAYCDFIVPSIVQKEGLTIAFSTQASSPAFSKALRVYFETRIPNGVGTFLKELHTLRQSMPKGVSRQAFFRSKVASYFQKYFT
jgi:precorrin-2 dehydrogenase/sirohydrochlorin ferrochelatase